jgi:hypothetical protein
MGSKILEALLKVIANNPTLLENVVEAALQLIASEMQKAVAKAKGQ